jgi:hypothetical protein
MPRSAAGANCTPGQLWPARSARPGCGPAVSHETRKQASVTPAPPARARQPQQCNIIAVIAATMSHRCGYQYSDRGVSVLPERGRPGSWVTAARWNHGSTTPARCSRAAADRAHSARLRPAQADRPWVGSRHDRGRDDADRSVESSCRCHPGNLAGPECFMPIPERFVSHGWFFPYPVIAVWSCRRLRTNYHNNSRSRLCRRSAYFRRRYIPMESETRLAAGRAGRNKCRRGHPTARAR